MEAIKRKRRPRGLGSAYQQGGKGSYYIKWVDKASGRVMVECTHSDDRAKAEKLLQRRNGASQEGVTYDPAVARVRMQDLFDDFYANRKAKETYKSLTHVEARWRLHLEPVFGKMKAAALTSMHLDRYRIQRRAEGAQKATTNRELALARAILRLGHRNKKLAVVPFVEMFDESDNVREGYLTVADFDKLDAACGKVGGLWLRCMLQIGFTYGWRLEEVRRLTLAHIDLARNQLVLHSHETKNGKPRQVPMSPTIRTMIEVLIDGKKKPGDRVFTRRTKLQGRTVELPVKDFRRRWQRAVLLAGLGHLICRPCHHNLDERARLTADALPATLKCPKCGTQNRLKQAIFVGARFHDLRRSMATSWDEAAVPREVIRKVAGWETDAMWRRYRQFKDKHSKAGLDKVEAYFAAERTKEAEAEADKVVLAENKLCQGGDAVNRSISTTRPN
jgi:integrase